MHSYCPRLDRSHVDRVSNALKDRPGYPLAGKLPSRCHEPSKIVPISRRDEATAGVPCRSAAPRRKQQAHRRRHATCPLREPRSGKYGVGEGRQEPKEEDPLIGHAYGAAKVARRPLDRDHRRRDTTGTERNVYGTTQIIVTRCGQGSVSATQRAKCPAQGSKSCCAFRPLAFHDVVDEASGHQATCPRGTTRPEQLGGPKEFTPGLLRHAPGPCQGCRYRVLGLHRRQHVYGVATPGR